jgi:hypothetical protein
MTSFNPYNGRRGVKGILLMAVLGVAVLAPGSTVRADVTNGDFAGGLAGWTTSGDVSLDGEVAVLGQDNSGFASLEQEFAIPAGSISLSFEYSPSFETEETFSAWLFDLDTWDALVATGDVDGDGLGDWFFAHDSNAGIFLNSPYVTAVDIGGGWSRVALDLSSLGATNALLAFDFPGLAAGGTGEIRVDNVSLVVPVPPAVVLFALGMGTAGTMLRRRLRRETV